MKHVENGFARISISDDQKPPVKQSPTKLPEVKSVTLRFPVSPFVQRILTAHLGRENAKSAILPIGCIRSLEYLLYKDRQGRLMLSSEGKGLLHGKFITKESTLSLETVDGTVEFLIEEILFVGKRYAQGEEVTGVVRNMESCDIFVRWRSQVESDNHTFTSETIRAQVNPGESVVRIPENIMKTLSQILIEKFFPELFYKPQDASQGKARQFGFRAFALIGGSGTGKTFGVQSIARFFSLLKETRSGRNLPRDLFPFVLHISVYDIVPRDDTLEFFEHMEKLNENLSEVLYTASLSRPFLLVFDDMNVLFGESTPRNEREGDEASSNPFFGSYHPLLKNFFVHSLNAFMDSERKQKSDSGGSIVFVFRERSDIPAALRGPYRIAQVFDMDSTEVREDPTRVFAELYRDIPSDEKSENRDINSTEENIATNQESSLLCPIIQRAAKNATGIHLSIPVEIHENSVFLHESMRSVHKSRCFCCFCTNLKQNESFASHCSDRNHCRTSDCCWLCFVALFTKGWNRSELMSLIECGKNGDGLDVRSAFELTQSYTPLALRGLACSIVDDPPNMEKEDANPSTSFIDECGAWSQIEMILINPLRSFSLSAPRPPTGILIHGQSGTGKTTLLSSIEHTLQSPRVPVDFSRCTNAQPNGEHSFRSINTLRIDATRIISKYVGESEANLTRLFRQARKLRPCVILADHIEQIIGIQRDSGETSKCEERLLSTFLTEMSGLYSDSSGCDQLVFIGATHYALDAIDPAALRSGRFDVHLRVDVDMDQERIVRVLDELLGKVPNTVTPGMLQAAGECLTKRTVCKKIVIADIEQLAHQAVWQALSRGSEVVEDTDVTSALFEAPV